MRSSRSGYEKSLATTTVIEPGTGFMSSMLLALSGERSAPGSHHLALLLARANEVIQ